MQIITVENEGVISYELGRESFSNLKSIEQYVINQLSFIIDRNFKDITQENKNILLKFLRENKMMLSEWLNVDNQIMDINYNNWLDAHIEQINSIL